ncbi:hypothetical protein BUE80_DR010331 [Diplocarpon rosae]|nr:hypothetical protein BUE80_DR010331 [Diplocarpon rosae]
MAGSESLGIIAFASDGIEALKLVALRSWRRYLAALLFVPLGILAILLACSGVNSLIGISSVSFPASVACLILLVIALILSDLVLGDRKTRALVKSIDVPAGFSLRYINIFFNPSKVVTPQAHLQNCLF